MRIAIYVACIACLAACDNAPSGSEPGGPAGGAPAGPIASGRADAGNSPNASTQVETGVAGDLPPAGQGVRFVGKWAADQKSCESAAWQFTETSLTTPAGSNCSFTRVTEVPGGYDIQATCTAEGPPEADTLKIRFAESAKAMLFESKAIAGNGLVFCGRDV